MESMEPPPNSPPPADSGDSSSDLSDDLPPHHHHYRLTKTQEEQLKVQASVEAIYNFLTEVDPRTQARTLVLWRLEHIEYLKQGLQKLAPSFVVLDSSRPWLCYWIVHALALLGEPLGEELKDRIVDFLSRCQDKDGGFCGGPGQLPHLATSYAAVNALVTIGTERAFAVINRDTMYKFLLRMKDSSGAFRMHDGGEIDVRACYTAVAVASLLNILDDKLVKDLGYYIARCQTYEGGIAGEPHSEAHGGYTFCGLAAMVLINETEKLDLPNLIGWVAFRQGVEGGFQGRANKLVDGCYSFWQGGALALTQKLLTIGDEHLKLPYTCEDHLFAESTCDTTSPMLSAEASVGNYGNVGFSFVNGSNQMGPLFHNIMLQQYILLCTQVLEGGLRDKPGKPRDYYHSCYCLSGLSVSQYATAAEIGSRPPIRAVLGPYSNLLEPVHPLYNLVLDKYHAAHEFFSRR